MHVMFNRQILLLHYEWVMKSNIETLENVLPKNNFIWTKQGNITGKPKSDISELLNIGGLIKLISQLYRNKLASSGIYYSF